MSAISFSQFSFILANSRASIPSMANTMGSFASGFTTIVDILSDNSGIGSLVIVLFHFTELVGCRFSLFLSSDKRCLFLLITLFAIRCPVAPAKPAFLHSDTKVLMGGCRSGSTGTSFHLDIRG